MVACHSTVTSMESVSQTRADVTHSGHAYVSVARPEPASSADHRPSRHPGSAPKFDNVGAAAAAVVTASEPLPASPVLTTRVDHQRESAPVGSVHTPLPSLPP